MTAGFVSNIRKDNCPKGNEGELHMKRALAILAGTILAARFLAVTVAAPALAQTVPPGNQGVHPGMTVPPNVPPGPAMRGEKEGFKLRRWRLFERRHPRAAQEIRENPALLHDPHFLQNHPKFAAYLRSHPRAREEFRERTRFARNDHDINRTRLHNYDQFADHHPALARKLARHPGLANDPQFLHKHPQFASFVKTHPGVREEMRENPRVFRNREHRFDQRADRGDRNWRQHHQDSNKGQEKH